MWNWITYLERKKKVILIKIYDFGIGFDSFLSILFVNCFKTPWKGRNFYKVAKTFFQLKLSDRKTEKFIVFEYEKFRFLLRRERSWFMKLVASEKSHKASILLYFFCWKLFYNFLLFVFARCYLDAVISCGAVCVSPCENA